MIRFAAAALSLTIALPAHAQAVEDLNALDARVRAMTGAEIGQPGGAITPLDRRMRLSACPESAAIERAGPDALAIRCASAGWRVRVGLMPAMTMQAAQGRQELVVRRGDTVEVSVEGESFGVTASGIALDDGAIGQSVRVKLAGNGNQSSGIVSGPGTISFSR